jgi:Tfp pilus assembly protein PilF
MKSQILKNSCSGEAAHLGAVAADSRADHQGGMALMTAKCFPLLVGFLALCVAAPAQKLRPAPTPSANAFVAARDFLAQGNLARALETTLAGLKSAPSSAEGYDLLGISYTQQRDYDEAQRAFEHALSLNPRSAAVHNELANCFAQQQKMDLAEKEYRTTLGIEPGDPVANYNLGMVLLEKGRPQGAIPYLRKLVPPDLPAAVNLIRAYLRAHQTEAGLAYARRTSEKGGFTTRSAPIPT